MNLNLKLGEIELVGNIDQITKLLTTITSNANIVINTVNIVINQTVHGDITNGDITKNLNKR